MTAANNPAVSRRLAAILIADVVGYTRLMERDDTGTFARLRTIRDEVVDPAVVSHDGRIVRTVGDGLMAEFTSALSALRAAVHIQREMTARNADVPTDERIEYRIGVNLGDVMVDGSDLAGDGINVAARLETVCEPGGICVSGSVREQVHGTLEVRFDDIGEQQVKNIVRPIRAFTVRIGDADPRASISDSRLSPSIKSPTGVRAARILGSQLWVASAIVVAIAVTALATSHFQLWPFRQDVGTAPPALSVGILPVLAQAGDRAALQQVESLTHDLSASLALAFQAIRVVPVNRLPSGMESSGGVSEIARTFNVRYLLEGSAQTGRDATEIRLRLVNGTSGEQVWNESLTLNEPVGAPAQLRASRTAMEHLGNRLISLETQRVAAAGASATAPMDYVMRAWALGNEEKTLERFRRQEALFDEALRRDPDLVPALLGVDFALDGQNDLDSTSVDRERLIARADEVTRRAVNLSPNAPESWVARAGVLMSLGRSDAALEASEKAIKLDPDAPYLRTGRGWLMSMAGRPAEALQLEAQAISLDPPGGWTVLRMGCEAHLLLGKYDVAIGECEKAAGRGGDEFDLAYFLAAAYAHTGATERVREEAAKILCRSPGFTIATLKAKRYSTNPDYLKLAEEHWYSGLRKAGIPEQ